jgi:hypothetical protein
MYIDPQVVSWILIGGASFCAFMIGILYAEEKAKQNSEDTIEHTIDWLIENNYVRHKLMPDGDVELIPLTAEDKK